MSQVTTLTRMCYITEDEGFNEEGKIARDVEEQLNRLKFDTYNKRYLVWVTVEELVDAPVSEQDVTTADYDPDQDR